MADEAGLHQGSVLGLGVGAVDDPAVAEGAADLAIPVLLMGNHQAVIDDDIRRSRVTFLAVDVRDVPLYHRNPALGVLVNHAQGIGFGLQHVDHARHYVAVFTRHVLMR